MATDKAQYAPYAVRSAEERYAYMLLHAPGGTGKEGEPVRGGAWLQEQVRMLAGVVPGMDKEPAGRVGDLDPALEAVIGRGAAEGFVSRDEGGGIRLTPRGRRAAGALWDGAGQRAREAASIAKRLLNDMDYWELVSLVHSAPHGAPAGPEVAEGIRRRRLGAAVSLARRHKVSIIRAASVAGMDDGEFEAELRRRGVHPYSLDKEAYEESLRTIDRISGH